MQINAPSLPDKPLLEFPFSILQLQADIRRVSSQLVVVVFSTDWLFLSLSLSFPLSLGYGQARVLSEGGR